MTITLFAQPYDISATGFYFTDTESYAEQAKDLTNAYGQPVEEFEIQFIDGGDLDCALAKAVGLSQCNFADFFDCAERWDEDEKRKAIIAVDELGYDFDPQGNPDDHEIDIYPFETVRDLAEQFVEEGLFGDIPEHLQPYIDHDAIARDLAMDYVETEIAGQSLIYRAS